MEISEATRDENIASEISNSSPHENIPPEISESNTHENTAPETSNNFYEKADAPRVLIHENDNAEFFVEEENDALLAFMCLKASENLEQDPTSYHEAITSSEKN